MVGLRRHFVLVLVVGTLFYLGAAQAVNAADLLYVYQPNNPDLDSFLVEHFEQRHNVIMMDSADPDLRDAALGADVVYVAESIGSGTIDPDLNGTVFFDVGTPVINAEAFAWDNAFLSGDLIHVDFGNTGRPEAAEADEALTELLDSLYIADPAHPMAAGFSGQVQVFEEPFSMNYASVERLGDGAHVVATVDEQGLYATSFVYEAGSRLADGSTAAGLRIGLFLGQGSSLPTPPGPLLLFDYISSDGLKMIDAAVDFALGLDVRPGDFDGDGILTLADIDQLTAATASGNGDAKYDVNGDGAVNRADVEQWIKDPELAFTWIGDSDLNGRFDSSDFVKVFTEGKYESGQAAVWSEGDWNGDGLFNSTDFVSAFTDGGYEAGPRTAVASVPEPGGVLLAVFGGCGMFGMTRRRK